MAAVTFKTRAEISCFSVTEEREPALQGCAY